MSGTPYVDADKIAETSEFLRNGGDNERAAAYLQCKVEDLPTLLDLPSKASANMVQEPSVDLWAVEKLEGQL
jgi:hypothetical protein